MSVYTEAGRGRKQCPSCKSYVGVRNHSCESCNHQFLSAQGKSEESDNTPVEVAPVERPTYDGPGRGRKQCPSCEVYVGVRNHECVCGYSFAAAKETVTPSPTPTATTRDVPIVRPTVVDNGLGNGLESGVVLTPAGPCPVELTGTAAAVVRQWSADVRKAYANKGQKIAQSALTYLAQRFYPFGTDEYNAVCSAIE